MVSSDQRFLAESGLEIFNGNELLLKGAFETPGGVHLLTGYPGSPVATFFDMCGKLRDVIMDKGICAKMANNEALASAMVNGSQMSAFRAIAVLKSVGLHVAADALALGNLAGAHPQGGAIIVSGDDPWSESTQVPADSRYLFQHLRMPVVEPSTTQEIKDFVPLSFSLSQASTLYIGYVITTTLADGGGTVKVAQNHWPEQSTNNPMELNTAALDIENTVLLPPRTGRKEEELPKRYAALLEHAQKLHMNPILGPAGKAKIGFITCGLAYQYLRLALSELGLADRFPILKLGVVYPLDDRQIAEFAMNCEHIVVVEERRGFVEQQVAEIINRVRQLNVGVRFAQLWGKRFPTGHDGIPVARGLHPSMVSELLIKFFRLADPAMAARSSSSFEAVLDRIRRAKSARFPLASRTPTFCPGCPHRDSACVLNEIAAKFADASYMKSHHRSGPIDLLFHGDTGCYSMLMFPPNERLMQNYSGMGLGAGTGAGIDPFIRNKQVVFMGDSTFFHSGQIAISNAIKARQDITFVILDNRTTGMTGHQPTPGLEVDVLGNITPKQNIDAIVRAITAMDKCTLVRMNPSNHKKYTKMLEGVILREGVKIVVADKECGIVTTRRQLKAKRAELRKKGFVSRETFMNITPEICELCLNCAKSTGCPGLTIEDTPNGPKMATDLSWCVNDGACAEVKACPSFEQVEVLRRRPPRPRGHQIKFERLPEPTRKPIGDVWRAYMTGVGGMGIGLATSILVRAGFREGYRIQFADKKGLAIRNGSVFSQIAFYKDNAAAQCQVIPYGQADLLLGLDLLEAARAIHGDGVARIASAERTIAIVNTQTSITIKALLGREELDMRFVEDAIRRNTRSDEFYSHNIASLCERLFGTKRYANITMLGLAYQRGLIPVRLESLEWAISHSLPADFKENLRAFNLGRKIVAHPELFGESAAPKTIARVVREKANILEHTTFGGAKRSRQYKYIAYTTLRFCRDLPRDIMADIGRYLYDLIQYEDVAYAQAYADRIKRIYRADAPEFGFAATIAAAKNLYKLMIVKDEFYVSHILTSYEKQRRDHHRYNVNSANGDQIRYRRVFHPRLFGRMISIPFPNWALYAMRELKRIRRFIPLYHSDDRQFLRWYQQLIDGFAWQTPQQYQMRVRALSAVDQVRGYREHRLPTMRQARLDAEAVLRGGATSSPLADTGKLHAGQMPIVTNSAAGADPRVDHIIK
jgi:indolepyruvate ferredoxin oxidoreductase